MSKLSFLPKATPFSRFGEELEIEEPIEFAQDDQSIENAFQEDYFLFILKSLPKDQYRVVALLLFIRNELGYNYTYKDIASIWGIDNSNIVHITKRIQKVCETNKIAPKKKTPLTDEEKCRVNFLSFISYNQT